MDICSSLTNRITKMKKIKIAYWATTLVFCLFMLFSATMYFANEEIKATFGHLGYPDYFRVQLGIAKYLGVAVLLIPGLPKVLKIFAYSGFTINMISAFIAHMAVGDPIQDSITPLFLLIVLGLSYRFMNRLNQHSEANS